MKVNVCDINTQTAIKVKGAGAKTSEDTSGVFLQLLLGGILNMSAAVPQSANLLTGNSQQNGETSTANTVDALSMLKQLGQADGEFTGAVFFGTQDSLSSADISKAETVAAGTGDGKISAGTNLVSQAQGYAQNLSQDFLKAIKAASDMKGVKTGLQDVDPKGTNINDAQGGDKGAPVEKTILGQQASGNKLAGIVLESSSTTDGAGLLKSGIKETVQSIEEMKPASSGKHDDEGFSCKAGDGQKAAKEDTSISSDAKTVLKSDTDFLQITAGLKQVSSQTGQTSVEKQLPVANKDDILNQVYSKIKVLNGESTSELHVSLKPDQMGDVSIKLVMEKGVINARITVENSNVKNIMETSMSQIKEHLKEQNVNVSHLSVYVGTGQKEANSGSNSQQYKWQHAKKVQSKGDAPVVNIQGTQYYGGVLNLLA